MTRVIDMAINKNCCQVSLFTFCFISLIILLLPIRYNAVAAGGDNDNNNFVTIYWIDTGMTFLGRPALKQDNFKSLFGVPDKNRLNVIMPTMRDGKGHERYLTEREWDEYRESLDAQLSYFLEQGISKGGRQFEIRTIQDINILGYFDTERQEEIVKFTQVFLSALFKVKKDLIKKGFNLYCHGAIFSNGAYAATKSIPLLTYAKLNPIDSISIYDGRACYDDVANLIMALNQNVSIINTSGDIPIAGNQNGVASLACSKRLKANFPNINVFFVDPEGLNLIFSKHCFMMYRDNIGLVKVFDGDKFHKIGKINATKLALLAIPKEGKHKESGLDSNISKTPRLPYKMDKKYKDGRFPPHFPDQPPPGAAAVPNVPFDDTNVSKDSEKHKNIGGVDMRVDSRSVQAESENKQKILNSRPRQDTLYWDIED